MNSQSFTQAINRAFRILLSAILLAGLAPVAQPVGAAYPPRVAVPMMQDPPAVPPDGVAITGPATGVVGASYPFTAAVTPVSASLPVTYTWQAAGQEPVTHAAVSSLTDTASLSWAAAGGQTVTVMASNAAGTVTATHTIDIAAPPPDPTVTPPPQADFSATPLSGVAPLTVTFTNATTGDYTTSEWDFGDGITNTFASPTHTYSAPGTYTVTLTVNGPGGSDTEAKTSYITTLGAVQADFSATPLSGTVPLTVTFTNATTGDYTTSEWNFGDGGPTSTEASPTHVYAAGGAYTVTLTVSGPGGSDTEAKASYITAYTPLQADFSATPLSGTVPLTVTFTNTTVGDYTTLSWDFGDGSPTSAETSPTHIYTTTGAYTVTLTASGPGGNDTEAKTGYITAYAALQAGFSATPLSGAVPLTVTFTNTTTGSYTASLWDFGDGVTSTLASPTHTYTAPGSYTVTLTATGPGGSDTKVAPDYIDVYAVRPAPGDCNTDIAIQNLGMTDALILAKFTSAEVGGTAWAADLLLPPKAGRSLPASEFGGAAAGTWAGAVDVSASEPLATVVSMFWDDAATKTAAMYTGVEVSATVAYLPYLNTAAGHETQLTVQNRADAEAAVTLHFYDRNGASTGNRALAIPPRSEKTLSLSWVPEADFPATDGLGTAYITADQPIAAVAAIHWPHASDAYSAAGPGDTVLWAPGMVRRQSTSDYSELVVQNTSDAQATVDVEFIKSDGSLAHSLDDTTIPARGAVTYSTYNQAALGDNWEGTVKVTSGDQPLVGVSFTWAGSTGIADNLGHNAIADSEAESNALAFPVAYRVLGGASDHWSAALLHNTAATTGTLIVEFYDGNGVRVGDSYTVTIPANGLVRLDLQDELGLLSEALTDLGDNFSGTMYVTPSFPVRVVGVQRVFWGGEGRAAAYTGFSVPMIWREFPPIWRLP